MAQQILPTPRTPTASSRIPINVIIIRPPLRLPQPSPTNAITTASSPPSRAQKPPPLRWLERTWRVTHSTLPIWKKAKNVCISYKVLPPTSGERCKLEDVVSFDHVDGLPESKLEKWLSMRRICGVDHASGDYVETISGDVDGLEEGEGNTYQKWQWKGNGWLKLTGGSRWEILGWGEYISPSSQAEVRECWAVTYFEASLFTPAGLDIMYSGADEISPDLYREIMEGIRGAGEGDGCREIKELGAGMFEVKIDR